MLFFSSAAGFRLALALAAALAGAAITAGVTTMPHGPMSLALPVRGPQIAMIRAYAAPARPSADIG